MACVADFLAVGTHSDLSALNSEFHGHALAGMCLKWTFCNAFEASAITLGEVAKTDLGVIYVQCGGVIAAAFGSAAKKSWSIRDAFEVNRRTDCCISRSNQFTDANAVVFYP